MFIRIWTQLIFSLNKQTSFPRKQILNEGKQHEIEMSLSSKHASCLFALPAPWSQFRWVHIFLSSLIHQAEIPEKKFTSPRVASSEKMKNSLEF